MNYLYNLTNCGWTDPCSNVKLEKYIKHEMDVMRIKHVGLGRDVRETLFFGHRYDAPDVFFRKYTICHKPRHCAYTVVSGYIFLLKNLCISKWRNIYIYKLKYQYIYVYICISCYKIELFLANDRGMGPRHMKVPRSNGNLPNTSDFQCIHWCRLRIPGVPQF